MAYEKPNQHTKRTISPLFPFNKNNSGIIDLYCLPSAGSSASMYGSWQNHAPEWLNIHPVEYPGHGGRIAEKLITDPAILSKEITEAILNNSDNPFALFGHSVGTAISWKIVDELHKRKQQHRLVFMAISGRPETSTLSNKLKSVHLLPRQQFIEAVAKYQGIPEELYEQEEVLDFFLSILRNDFEMNSILMNEPPINTEIPLIAMSGQDDPDIQQEQMMIKWSTYSKNWLGYYPFSGAHFYLNTVSNRIQIINIISQHLSEIMNINNT